MIGKNGRFRVESEISGLGIFVRDDIRKHHANLSVTITEAREIIKELSAAVAQEENRQRLQNKRINTAQFNKLIGDADAEAKADAFKRALGDPDRWNRWNH